MDCIALPGNEELVLIILRGRRINFNTQIKIRMSVSSFLIQLQGENSCDEGLNIAKSATIVVFRSEELGCLKGTIEETCFWKTGHPVSDNNGNRDVKIYSMWSLP
jgi:hypothetical protein